MDPNLLNSAYLSQRELAGWLGKSPRYVRNLARKKIIPEVRPPGMAPIYDVLKVRAALEKFETRAI